MIALVAGFGVGQVEARTLHYSTPAPPTDRPTNRVLRWWAEEVSKRTNGSLDIEIHWLQSLLKFKDAAKGIQAGIADIGPVSPEYSTTIAPLLGVSQTELGSGDNYVAVEAWSRTVKDSEAMDKEALITGLKPIGYYSSGFRANLSTTRPYISPEDFKGDKVRLTNRGIIAAKAEDWDVTPVNLTFADFYSALERGTVDGVQSYIYLILPYKHNEVVKYVVQTGIGQSLVAVMMNQRVWNSLSPEEQKVISDLEPIFNEKMAQAGLEAADMALDALKNNPDYPVEFYRLNEEQRKVWEEEYTPAVNQYVADLAKRNPAATEIHQKLLAELNNVEKEVREQGYPWERN
ncbi:TRAP transporter substrate-binding protein [Marinobacter salinexigens]|nr:TRAP transporter substrate-binding protein DctP [Marinobacter salinexigens]